MSTTENQVDIVLAGAGIMSATLAAILKELQPDYTIALFEMLDGPAEESSSVFNNAGTGHAALCELNYTPQAKDGSVDIKRALKVNTDFDLSRQFWSYLVKKGAMGKPDSFIHDVPHISFVRGASDVAFLKARHAAMTAHHCFRGMEYSEDRATLNEWMPLVMENRAQGEVVAATRMITGTDVDFGAVTRALLANLATQSGFSASYNTKVTNLAKRADGRWDVTVKDKSGAMRSVIAKFVFLGAGGGAITLLQKSGIAEGKGFAGFPVSGLFLKCDVPELTSRHLAKVYGKASVGAPPMSVPHLDTRYVDGRRSLLFGPYAGFSTKFLKHGSLGDLFGSIKGDNIGPLLAVGRDNWDLTKYLIGQLLETMPQKYASLREYFPGAKDADWELIVAGQRVQVIMPDAQSGGKLQFGTELVVAGDGSIVAMLGASPGASTAVAIMLSALEKAFKNELPGWKAKLAEMIPSYGKSIADDAALCASVRAETAATLGLQNIA
jgi:malate dehydrogenase (quinone)